jgi:hypothetical protein
MHVRNSSSFCSWEQMYRSSGHEHDTVKKGKRGASHFSLFTILLALISDQLHFLYSAREQIFLVLAGTAANVLGICIPSSYPIIQ